MVPLRVGVLGPVTTWHGEHEVLPGLPRQQAVLCTLAMRANRVVSRGELVDAVWGQQAPVSAEGGIYTYVAGLRRILEPDRESRKPAQVLVSAGAGYMLRLSPSSLDAAVFEESLDRARKLRAAGDLAGASGILAEALGLWRGVAFAGVPGPFADAERQRLSELCSAAAEERADLLLAQGQPAEAVPHLTVLVAEHPLRERTRGLLMVALYRCGRQAEALQIFRDAREVLAEDLGIDPGAELTRIHQQVLAMDPELDAPSPPAAGTSTIRIAAAPGDGAGSGGAANPASAGTAEAGTDAPAQVPLGIPGFAGRRSELEQLHNMLPCDSDATVPIAAITGTAGVGKTALAIRFARTVSGRFPDGQLYVNLRGFDPSGTPVDPSDALRGFFDALRVPPRRVPDGLEAQIGLFRSLLDGKQMLVVLDNARTTEQVRPLLPGSPGCMVVITSRSQLTGLVAAEGARPLALDVLTEDESREVLTGRLGAERIAAEPSSASELIRLSARLPLALSVTTARAATRPGLTLAGLAAELRDTQVRLDALDTGEPTTNVRAVFSWSYEQLSEPAARMFRMLGVHPGPDVSAPAAASLAGVSLAEARTELAELTRASLLAEDSAGRFGFHDLLRTYAAERARVQESHDELAAAQLRLLDHYLRTAYGGMRRMYPARVSIELPAPMPGVVAETFAAYEQVMVWFQAEHEVLLTAVAHADAEGLDVYCWQLAWTTASLLNRRGRLHDLAASQRIALRAAQRLDDQAALGHIHHQLGCACGRLGDADEADDHLREALELFTGLGDRVGVAEAHNGLALVLDHQGRYAEALPHAREALRLRRSFGERARVAYSENAVGWLYAHLGHFTEAMRHCRRAVELHRESGSRSGAADALDSIGFACNGLGDHDQAISHYQQSLAIFREIGDPAGQASSLTGLGDAQLAADHPDAARRSWEQALAILDVLPYGEAQPIRTRLDRISASRSGDVPPEDEDTPRDVAVAPPRPPSDASSPGAVRSAR